MTTRSLPARSLPTRTVPERPDLAQLKRQARELRDAFRAGEAAAAAEVQAHYRDADPSAFALHDAQLVLARAYGFASWPKLKAFADGMTARRFAGAVRAGDVDGVRRMLRARPELAGSGLHAAVTARAPGLVRLLMQHGANARTGIYPHREATTALTIASDRGYDEIVALIHEEERLRQEAKSGVAAPADALFEAVRCGDADGAIALLRADPTLVHVRQAVFDWTPLVLAAARHDVRMVTWLLERGADPRARARVHPFDDPQQRPGPDRGWTALDAAASNAGAWGENGESKDAFAAVAELLLRHGAALTPRGAVALGNAEWLRARHAEAALFNDVDETGGLLRIAVSHDRADILALLLGLGFDPDERTRFRDVGPDGVVLTWGMPLWHCAASGRHAMAELLLAHGAHPNADVYASGTPLSQAYGRGDRRMIALLEQHGARLDAEAVGLYRLTDRARALIADATGSPVGGDATPVAEQLLRGAACGGDAEIVALALAGVTWPRDDPRWYGILEQPLRIWNHGRRFWSHEEWDRATYLECFRLIVARCDPNVRGRADGEHALGLTILHTIAGSREHVTATERLAFATVLLDAGARLDVRDRVLDSTPLGWACRWGRGELVALYLSRGADPTEAGAAPWATPLAWARKYGHAAIEAQLRAAGAS